MEAAGDRLRWHVDDFTLAIRALPPLERRQVARIANRFTLVGMRLEVLEGSRLILTVGSERPSLAGRIAFGDPYIRPHLLWRWLGFYRAARRSR